MARPYRGLRGKAVGVESVAQLGRIFLLSRLQELGFGGTAHVLGGASDLERVLEANLA